VSPGLERVRKPPNGTRRNGSTALLHHVDVELLWQAYFWLKPEAGPRSGRGDMAGVRARLEEKLKNLREARHRGSYGQLPSRRRCIRNRTERQRPPRDSPWAEGSRASRAEDKIVQRAVVEVLNAIYEEDFLGSVCCRDMERSSP